MAARERQAPHIVRVPDERAIVGVTAIAGSFKPGPQGETPDLRWVPIGDLRINWAYQRNLSDRSLRLIRAMVTSWAWPHVKALSVFPVGAGLFEIVDGQHTAIAAATRRDIPQLPCLVTAERPETAAARDFVSLNTQRLALTPTQLFQARLVAGDAEAELIVASVERGGGRILRNPTPSGYCKPGDTVALGVLARLANTHPVLIERIIALAIQCSLAPVPASFIKAAELLLAGPANWRLGEAAITRAVRKVGLIRLTRHAADLRAKFPLTPAEAMAKAIRTVAAGELLVA